jgi:ABC-type multidrug transport system fused ATPase/permease subunit
MSAIAQPAAAVSAVKVKKPSGWDQLKTLIPYVRRYKAMTALGLFTNTLTGLVGALPQLVIGAITDCLTGSPQTLATLQGSARAVLAPLFSFYAPLSRTALGKYCIILIAIMAVKGFFSFWSRWILIGVSREIEFDLTTAFWRWTRNFTCGTALAI